MRPHARAVPRLAAAAGATRGHTGEALTGWGSWKDGLLWYRPAWSRERAPRGGKEGQLGSYAIQYVKRRLEYSIRRTGTGSAAGVDEMDAGGKRAKVSRAQSSSPFRVAQVAPL